MPPPPDLDLGTAAIIIMSGTLGNDGGNDGIQITQAALSSQVGSWGGGFVAIAILLFAFTSLVANYSYGESNIEYIAGKKNAKAVIMVYRFAVLGMVMLGAVASLKNIWNFADLSMGAMALINLIAILLLSPLAFRIFKDYDRQHKAGKEPTFDPEQFPELKGKVDASIWKK